MMKTLFVSILAFPLVVFFSNCSDNSSIKEDKFIKIYADLIIAQDTIKSTQKMDSLRNVIFKKYGVNREKYQAAIASYNEDPERWKIFFDKAMVYIETLKSKDISK